MHFDPMSRAILDALDASTAILAGDGEILAVNQAWREFGRQHSAALCDGGVGLNYLGVCDAADGLASGGAREVSAGIRQVLAGEASALVFEYACHSPDTKRWMRLRVVPLDHESARAIVFHEDATDQRRDLRAARRRLTSLSDRETEILRFVVNGMASKNIANELGISLHTVENHRRAIIRKTGAANTADLVRIALLGGRLQIDVEKKPRRARQTIDTTTR